MEYKIVNKYFLATAILFNLMYLHAQCDDDFYSLFKGGKKYKKIIGYIMLNKDSEKKIIDKNTIIYNINNASFEHSKKCHTSSVCTLKEVENLKISTIEELGETKEKILQLRLQEENIKIYPRPLNHKMLKIYLIEQIDDYNFRKIEVEWLYKL